MISVILLLIILLSTLFVTRIASEALVLTGLSRTVARFQARSAYSGAGFTTSESECIVRNPVRRKIISWMMLIGKIGSATVIGSLILSFSNSYGINHWGHLAILAGGLLFLLWLMLSKWVDRQMVRMIAFFLAKYAKIQVADYGHLMHISEDYGISAIPIPKESWLADRNLKNVERNKHGLVLLGIDTPGGDYNGVPSGDNILHAGDVLIVYGLMSKVEPLREIVNSSEMP